MIFASQVELGSIEYRLNKKQKEQGKIQKEKIELIQK